MRPIDIMREAWRTGYQGSISELLLQEHSTAPEPASPSAPVTPSPPISMRSRVAEQTPTLVRSYEQTEPGIRSLRHDTSPTVLTQPQEYATGGWISKANDFLRKKGLQ